MRLISTASADGTATNAARTAAWETDIARALDSQQWQLILLPTEQCNFRCTYCYESFKNRKMSAETVAAIKRLIAKRLPELKSFNIQWFGGEPLLAISVIREIGQWVLDQLTPDTDYVSSMTTNGALLNTACLEELTRLKIKYYQISLDGWRDGHDQTRLRKGGGATFDTIWHNLIAAQRSNLDFLITLRVHFGPHNLASVKQLLCEISRAFGVDSRFKVFLKEIGHYGGAQDEAIKVYDAAEAVHIRQNLNALITMAQPPLKLSPSSPYMCYAAKPNSLIIRSTGRIAKCTVALESDANDVGFLDAQGELNFDQSKLSNWFAGIGTGNKQLLSCPWSALKES